VSDFETQLDLVLQGLAKKDRLLALASFAMQREDDGWFQTSDLVRLNRGFRLPNPGNVSQHLGKLRQAELAVSRGRTGALRWTLTPHGQREARTLLADAGQAVAPSVDARFMATFLHTRYPTLPPELAPPEILPKIRPFLERYPFESNVFLMTRFPTREEADPIAQVIEAARKAVAAHGLVLHVGFDRAIHDEVWPNTAAHMWACRYGLGLLETSLAGTVDSAAGLDAKSLKAVTLNDNVLLELGSMLTLGRRCKILKDGNAPQPPSDLTSQIYRTVDLSVLDTVTGAVHEWITEDLML
jgi:hypothetical protein